MTQREAIGHLLDASREAAEFDPVLRRAWKVMHKKYARLLTAHEAKHAEPPADLDEQHVFLDRDVIKSIWHHQNICAACGRRKDLGHAFCEPCWSKCSPPLRKALRKASWNFAEAWCRAFFELKALGIQPGPDLLTPERPMLWAIHHLEPDTTTLIRHPTAPA